MRFPYFSFPFGCRSPKGCAGCCCSCAGPCAYYRRALMRRESAPQRRERKTGGGWWWSAGYLVEEASVTAHSQEGAVRSRESRLVPIGLLPFSFAQFAHRVLLCYTIKKHHVDRPHRFWLIRISSQAIIPIAAAVRILRGIDSPPNQMPSQLGAEEKMIHPDV